MSKVTSISGVYSGIFAMYLHYHTTSNNMKPHLTLFALCLLYALSVFVLALEIAVSWLGTFVSNNEYLF